MTEIKLCRVEGCNKPKRKKRSMCATHIYRWQEHKSIDLPLTKPEGTITNCKTHGYLTKEQTYSSGKTRHGKKRFRCKKCRYEDALTYRKLNRANHLKQSRNYEKNNTKRRSSRFKERLNKYGITIEQYEEILKKQSGLCAICNRKKRLCIDHCHKTGKVRGLLCFNCNALLGQANDSIEIIDSSKAYLLINK
jgi:hypothetical protein